MGNLQTRHWVETAIWLALILFFYYHSFAFDKEIEIYKYGASAWPRAILLFMVVVVLGQLAYYWTAGDGKSQSMLGAVMEDPAEKAMQLAKHSGFAWYASTLLLVALPFIYMNLPQILAGTDKPNDPGLNSMKLICAAVLIAVYLLLMWRNHVGGILALPILFAAMLEDLGFYSLAPLFIAGIMFLMGERRIKPMLLITPLIMGLLLLFFVKLLYVGLPTGNIKPFYDIGNWVITLLQ